MNQRQYSQTASTEQTNSTHGAWLVAAMLALLVTGCSAAPSDSEIKDALQRLFGGLMGGGPLGDTLKVEVKSVEKLGCEKSGDAFVCDVEAEMSSKVGASFGKKAMRVRMAYSAAEATAIMSRLQRSRKMVMRGEVIAALPRQRPWGNDP